jgi:hypothetical protein
MPVFCPTKPLQAIGRIKLPLRGRKSILGQFRGQKRGFCFGGSLCTFGELGMHNFCAPFFFFLASHPNSKVKGEITFAAHGKNPFFFFWIFPF